MTAEPNAKDASAPGKASRRPLWFWLLMGLGVLVGVPVVLVAILLWALSTDAGTAWTLEQIPGLQTEQAQGSLLGQWQAEELGWQGYGVGVVVNTPHIDWSPSCLFRLTLCLEQLSAETLDVTLQPTAEEPSADTGVRPLVLILGVTVLVWLLPSSPVPPDPLTIRTVRVVQPNIGQQDKWRPGFDAEAARRLATLSGPPGDEPRLLLWPEAAITDPTEDARTGEHQAMAEFQRTRATAILGPNDRLITGGIAIQSRDGIHVDGAANSIFVLSQGGRVRGRYDKAHLVPYGEYLPMRPLLSAIGLSRLAPGDIDFNPGPGPRTIWVGEPWGKVGLQLCYEIIFSGHVVDWQDRPDFIFNPSNDAWFGRWGPPQHLAQARLRAAEEGIPVIRATPTGISAVIDARGNVVKELKWRTEGVIDAVLPPAATAATPFARFGNIIPLLLGFALLIGGIVLGRRRR